MEGHNSFAGTGAVVLDIGEDVGALLVHMPATMLDVEIEIRPVGERHGHNSSGEHTHPHDHDHDAHDHDAHDHHLPHVAVVGRPTAAGIDYTCVFGQLAAGSYELYERPAGPVRLRADIVGGEVTDAHWPA